LSVAIIGAGGIGRVRANSIRESETAFVSRVVDVDLGRAEQLAKPLYARSSSDWREVVSDPTVDCVVVSTPTKFHAEIAKGALEAGKHVLCEKPLARNVREAHAVLEAAERTGRVLKTGFNYRAMAHVRKAQELLDAGTIGTPYFLRCRYGHGGRPRYEDHWCTDAELSGGGVLQEQGIHILDLTRILLGEPVKVMAQMQCYFWPFGGTEDNCFCLLETAAGQVAQIHVSWTQWKNILEIEVFGRDGYLRLEGRDGHYGPQRVTVGKRQATHGTPIEEVFTFDHAESCWNLEWQAFTEMILNGTDRRSAALQGFETQKIVEAAYKSAAEHRWIATCAGETRNDHHSNAV
jgi:predicted dehydrogenase